MNYFHAVLAFIVDLNAGVIRFCDQIDFDVWEILYVYNLA